MDNSASDTSIVSLSGGGDNGGDNARGGDNGKAPTFPPWWISKRKEGRGRCSTRPSTTRWPSTTAHYPGVSFPVVGLP